MPELAPGAPPPPERPAEAPEPPPPADYLTREEILAASVQFWPATYSVWRVRMTIGSPLTFPGGERVVAVLGTQYRGSPSEVEVTMLVELPTQQAGDDMSGQLGDNPELCPSCGGKDDHSWIRSAGGLIACQKRTEAHLEGT